MNGKHLILSNFWIKIIAMVTMAFDHVGVFLTGFYASTTTAFAVGTIFRYVGRIAFPLFVFLLVEGIVKSKNPRKYVLRIAYMWLGITVAESILFAMVRAGVSFADSITPFVTANAFTDLVCIASALYFLTKETGNRRALAILPIAGLALSSAFNIAGHYGYVDGVFAYYPAFLRADYGIYGLLLGLGYYYAKPLAAKLADKAFLYSESEDEEILRKRQSLENVLSASAAVLVIGIFAIVALIDARLSPTLAYISGQTFALIAVFFLFLYSGRRGYDAKWFRYVTYFFYPVHIIIIGLIFLLI